MKVRRAICDAVGDTVLVVVVRGSNEAAVVVVTQCCIVISFQSNVITSCSNAIRSMSMIFL